MKRNHKVEKYSISTHYTYFEWNRCCKCDMDFRREVGLKFLVGQKCKYICKECSDVESIFDFIQNDEWLPPKPPSPKSIKGRWDASFRNMKIANDILKKWEMDKMDKCEEYEIEEMKVEVDGDNINVNIKYKAPINKVDINFVAKRDEVDKTVPPLKAQILTEGGI